MRLSELSSLKGLESLSFLRKISKPLTIVSKLNVKKNARYIAEEKYNWSDS